MSKIQSVQIVVSLTQEGDNDVIEADEVSRETLLEGLKETLPYASPEELDKQLELHIGEMVETLSQISKLTKLTVTENSYLKAINPSLVKSIDFLIEREE